MTPTRSAARDLAARLTAEHDRLKSWRKVARLYPPEVKPGTLNRIANEKGRWLPKKRAILKALGLVGERRREWLPGELRTARKIGKMARETKEAVLKR